MDNLLGKVEKLILNCQYSDALALLQENGEFCQGMADYHHLKGVTYHHLGAFSQAIDELEKSIAINPLYTQALLNLTILLNDLGMYDKAKDVFHRIEQVRSGYGHLDRFARGKLAENIINIANIYLELHRYDDAILEFRKALVLKNDMVDVKVALAKAYLDTNDTIKAISELEEAKAINPKYVEIYLVAALAYFNVGNREKAVNQWKEAAMIAPNCPEVAIMLDEYGEN